MKKILIGLFVIFVMTGCASKNSSASKMAKSIFDNPVLVNVQLDPEDPENGKILEIALKKMASNRLNLRLTENTNEASSYILVNNYTINTVGVTKDDDGNVIRYSVYIAMQVAMKDRMGFWSQNVTSGTYVVVKAKSLLSQQEKEKATKEAIQKAIDDLIAEIVKRSNKVGSSVQQDRQKSNRGEVSIDTSDVMTNNNDALDSMSENNTLTKEESELKQDLQNLGSKIQEYSLSEVEY